MKKQNTYHSNVEHYIMFFPEIDTIEDVTRYHIDSYLHKRKYVWRYGYAQTSYDIELNDDEFNMILNAVEKGYDETSLKWIIFKVEDPERYKEYQRWYQKMYRRTPKGQKSSWFYQIRKREIAKGNEWNLNIGDVTIPDTCPLLGIPISFGGDKMDSPTIDRFDRSKGYTLDNIWVISMAARNLKGECGVDEMERFLAIIKKEQEFRKIYEDLD